MEQPITPPEREPSASFVKQITGAQQGLFTFILTMVHSVSDADDVLQETNMVLWRKREEFTEGSNFWPWACRFAQFQVLAFRKKNQRDHLQFDDDLVTQLAIESGELTATIDLRQQALEKCLDGLSDQKRKLITLRYSSDQSATKMATQMGLTRGALYDALYRIRLSLARCVEQALSVEGGNS